MDPSTEARLRRRALTAALFVALLTPTERAFAQAAPAERQQAEALFAEGRDLLEKGKFVEACAKLAQSEQLSSAIGTALNLAYCYEQIGKLRSAMDAYAAAESFANAAGDTKRAQFAHDRFVAIEPRAPKLAIRIVPPEAPGMEIARNGIVLPKSELDRPVAVDAQDYVITASAPGYLPWKGVIIVRGEGAVVTMMVPPLGDSSTTAAPLPPPSPFTARRLTALGLGAVSMLAIGGGTALAFAAKSHHEDAASHCDASGCDETGASIQHTAVVQGNIATALIGLGAMFGATGIYLWIVGAPESKARPAPAHAAVGVDVNPFGAALTGRF